MSDSPLFFSVVIPLYNKAYSIVNTIKTVLEQNYHHFEIVVVDDGSTDDSLNLIENNFKKEILDGKLIIHHSENKGVSSARNIGVDLSSSDYICFLDADDEWKEFFLENMESLVRQCPSAKLYFLQHEKNHNNTRVAVNKVTYPKGYLGLVDNYFKSSIYYDIANSSKVCVKRDAIEYVSGFPVGEKSGEDLYVWMEIAIHFPVALFNVVSAKTNLIFDNTREQRACSVPYPFKYYSEPRNIKKLNFWSKLYLYRIYVAHIVHSIRTKDPKGYCIRVSSGRILFPFSSSIFQFSYKLFLKKIFRHYDM